LYAAAISFPQQHSNAAIGCFLSTNIFQAVQKQSSARRKEKTGPKRILNT